MPVTRSSMSVSVSEKEAAAALLALKRGIWDVEINGKFYEIKKVSGQPLQPSSQASKRPKRECAVYTPGMYAESDE